MYHVLTIEWEAKNLFTGRMAAHRVSYRLTWEGVKALLSEPFYRAHGARFALHPYTGQVVDN